MDVIHIEARHGGKSKLSVEDLSRLPERVALTSTVQFTGLLQAAQAQLAQAGKKVSLLTSNHAWHRGQILGCDIPECDADAVLFMGDGTFHPKMIALKARLPVFCFNPFSGKLQALSTEDVTRMEKRLKAAIALFLSAGTIGIIVSTKPGQHKAQTEESLRARYPEKIFYTFLADRIDLSELENFQFIDAWVNTACPRISYDDSIRAKKAIVNLEDVI